MNEEEERTHEEEIISEKTKEELKNKISAVTKSKYTSAFILIFLVGILIRLYFLYITRAQPLWWDEADYMAFAKNLAGVDSITWIVTAKHNSIFPFIVSIFMRLSMSEVFLKFILEVLPS